MAKSLKDILAGVKSSKTEPMDLKDLAMSPEGNKAELDFAAKHKIEKHADRAGNGDEIYKGKTKKTDFKRQSDSVYEMAMCNHTTEGTYCEAHGKTACPTEDDVNKNKPMTDKKGRQYIADKKMTEEIEYIEEKLTAKQPISKWIHDFVHSDNPKFSGKSTKERQKMALGAYYSAKKGKTRNEQADTVVTFPGQASATTGGTDLDSTRV